jgi:hypothetical protein
MNSWLLLAAAAAEPVPEWAALAPHAGLTVQASVLSHESSVNLETGPTVGLAWYLGFARLDLQASALSSENPLGVSQGDFLTRNLALTFAPSIRSRSGRPVLYLGGGAALGRYHAEVTEYRWHGWHMDHDEDYTALTVHGAVSWRMVHTARCAVDLDYVQRYNTLDAVFGPRHRLLGVSVSLLPVW